MQQQQQVLAETHAYIQQAGDYFQRVFKPIPVHFNLKGRIAGMYKVHFTERQIRYNPYLFAKYFTHNMQNTIPHEVAHYIADELYGLNRIHAHGKEWKAIMKLLGAEPKATFNFDLQGIPQRKQRRFPYRCRCRAYELTTRRHNLITSGQRAYYCRACRAALVWHGD